MAMAVAIFWWSGDEEEDEKGNKKRRKGHFAMLILVNGVGAVLVYFGSCRFDMLAEIVLVAISAITELITTNVRNNKD